MNLLSIQSHVAYGHVGNAAAVFTLERLGCEVWPIHTVAFSNHPGYGAWRGTVFEADLVRDLVRGIEERGVLGACDGVLSGYMGSAAIGEAILEAVARVKAANPAARYCCDPVIGDAGRGRYVRPEIPVLLRERALAQADVVTPNQFELGELAGGAPATLAQVLAAVDAVHALGPRVVLVTSLRARETPEDAVDVLVSATGSRWRVRTPLLPLAANGAGDALAAAFFAHLLRGAAPEAALSHAVSALFGVLTRTCEAGARELMLIAAQEELVKPTRVFEPEPVR